MRHQVITSFHESGYIRYGKRCLESFLEYWPKDCVMRVYAEDVHVDITDDRLEVVDHVASLPKLRAFRDMYQNNPYATGTNPHDNSKTDDFRWDAIRFSNKVFAVTDAIPRAQGSFDQLLWLDADTVTRKPIPKRFIDDLSPTNRQMVSLLNRRSYPECGWVGYNLKHPRLREFCRRFEDMYLTGQFLELKESHDSFVFWHICKDMSKASHTQLKKLGSDRATGHIFINSVLGKYLDHLKGDRKEAGRSYREDLRRLRLPSLRF